MKRCFLASILLSMSILAYASSYPANLEGIYDSRSIEVGTQENSVGTMVVTKTGETYSIKTTFTDGSFYTGTGVYDMNKHVFAIAFINPNKKEESGVVLADVKKDSSMTSIWTYLNKSTIGRGSCIKRK